MVNVHRHLSVAQQYYGLWLGVEPDILIGDGIYAVCSPERDVTQQGYSRRFDVLALLLDRAAILSYSARCTRSALLALEHAGQNPARLEAALIDVFGADRCSISVKYVFSHLPEGLVGSASRRLVIKDCDMYMRFYADCHGLTAAPDWVREYFLDMVREEKCWGAFEGEALASAVDEPDTPYLHGIVFEPGIYTHPAFRRRGYARRVCAAAIAHALEQGRTPLWSTSVDNAASQRLALSLGFVPFGRVTSIAIDK